MHKRSTRKLQERKIRGLILRHSFVDKRRCEVVSRVTQMDILALLHEPVEVHLVPDVEKGEVLIDSCGRGTLQRPEKSP